MPDTNFSFGGNIPENYDRYLGPYLFEPYAQDIAERIKSPDAKNILEIACGTGRVTKHLRKLYPYTVKITATDINPDMLTVAKKNIVDNSIEYKVADAQELPFADDTFDVIVCQFGYMFVPDKTKAFSEAYRVLKKGGCFLFSTWDAIENNPIINTVNKIITGYLDAPPQFFKTPFSMFKKDELLQLMENAHFTKSTATKIKKEATSHSALEVVKGMVTGNPIYNEIIQKDPSAPAKLIEKAEQEVLKTYGIYAKSNLNAWVVKGFK